MTPRYLALRFVHPDFDCRDESSGLGLATNADRTLQLVEGSASVRQAVLMLLSTQPGERVMRPDYGCNLHRLVFAPNDGTTAGLAIHYIRRALERWEPRIEILSLDAHRSEDHASQLNIALDYRIRSTHVDDHVLITLDLMTGEA